MKVITISGKAQHGKDTTATMLKELLNEQGYSVLITHYGDLVKYICTTFFDWDGRKDEYGRSLLQYVGTDVIRNQVPDYWVDFVSEILCFFSDKWDYVLIPDCRFPNEVDKLKKFKLDTTHLRIIRPNFKSPLTEEQQAHISETALDDVRPDFYIMNDGTLEDLKEKVWEFISEYHSGYHQVTFEELLSSGCMKGE